LGGVVWTTDVRGTQTGGFAVGDLLGEPNGFFVMAADPLALALRKRLDRLHAFDRVAEFGLVPGDTRLNFPDVRHHGLKLSRVAGIRCETVDERSDPSESLQRLLDLFAAQGDILIAGGHLIVSTAS
jgi:hypothetical protein